MILLVEGFCEAEEACVVDTSFWSRVRGEDHLFYTFSDLSVPGYQTSPTL
jgi:hypothetical protein